MLLATYTHSWSSPQESCRIRNPCHPCYQRKPFFPVLGVTDHDVRCFICCCVCLISLHSQYSKWTNDFPTSFLWSTALMVCSLHLRPQLRHLSSSLQRAGLVYPGINSMDVCSGLILSLKYMLNSFPLNKGNHELHEKTSLWSLSGCLDCSSCDACLKTAGSCCSCWNRKGLASCRSLWRPHRHFTLARDCYPLKIMN